MKLKLEKKKLLTFFTCEMQFYSFKFAAIIVKGLVFVGVITLVAENSTDFIFRRHYQDEHYQVPWLS